MMQIDLICNQASMPEGGFTSIFSFCRMAYPIVPPRQGSSHGSRVTASVLLLIGVVRGLALLPLLVCVYACV